MSISDEKATEIATEKLHSQFRGDLALMSDQAVRITQGWIFFWNSKRFIATRNWEDGVVGNGPIFVSNSGDAQFLPTHTHWKELVNKL